MIAKELISDGIIPLKTNDTGRIALEWMEDFRVSHLPIVNESQLLGLVTEYDVYNHNQLDEPIGNYSLSLHNTFVLESQHLYDVMRLVQLHGLSLIPVVDNDNNYLGSITLQRLLQHFSATLSVSEPGGIIILELNIHDYVLSEIARIVESNDTKILSLFIHFDPVSQKMRLTLKLNKMEISGLLQTFSRFNYEVIMSYGAQDDLDDLRERYDALMSYLKV